MGKKKAQIILDRLTDTLGTPWMFRNRVPENTFSKELA